MGHPNHLILLFPFSHIHLGRQVSAAAFGSAEFFHSRFSLTSTCCHQHGTLPQTEKQWRKHQADSGHGMLWILRPSELPCKRRAQPLPVLARLAFSHRRLRHFVFETFQRYFFRKSSGRMYRACRQLPPVRRAAAGSWRSSSQKWVAAPAHHVVCVLATGHVSAGLQRLTPDAVSYNVAISACQKQELWQWAMLLLHELWDSRLRASVITYRASPVRAGAMPHFKKRGSQTLRCCDWGSPRCRTLGLGTSLSAEARPGWGGSLAWPWHQKPL